MEKALEFLGVGVIVLEDKGRVVYANRFCIEEGLLKEDYRGKLYYEVLRSLELIGVVEEFIKGERDTAELSFRDKHYTLSFFQEDKVIQVMDMTENHRLRRSHKEFVAYVSHELSTPITAVRGLLETMLLSGEMNSKLLERAVFRLKEMSRLVDSLKLFTLPESSVEVRKEAFKLADVVLEAVEDLQSMAQEMGIQVEVKIPDRLSIESDREKLYMLLRNILENAIRYNVEEGNVAVKSSVEGGEVVLEVRDTGVGIPERELPFVFEPFYGGKNRKGMGLGLAISRRLAEILGGSIEIDSEEGKGTTLRVRLPQTSNL